jgi:ABC-type uncharacterized transport system substrate-binding protein
MKRREFIAAVGSAAVWPIAARAQQPEQMRRIGVLMNKAADDSLAHIEVSAFESVLQEHGWKVGDNVQIDYRWGAGDANLYRKFAAELVALAPNVLFGIGGTVVGALQQTTRDVPIVFVETTDPVNRITGKWLELLKEIAPGIKRVAVIRDPSQFSGVGELAAIQAIAPSLSVELSPVDTRQTDEIEHAITDFARQPNGGVIVTPSGASIKNRHLIITLANQHRLPVIYAFRYFATDGGLMSYGPDESESYRLAAGYIDRILKGEKAADLPVQAPTKIELVINLKTAEGLGLTIPPALLAAANAVIE